MLPKKKYYKLPMFAQIRGRGKVAPRKPAEGAISIDAEEWRALADLIEKKPAPNEALLRAMIALDALVE